MHGEKVSKPKAGGSMSSAAGSPEAAAGQSQGKTGPPSLQTLLQNLITGGRSVIGKLWGNSPTPAPDSTSSSAVSGEIHTTAHTAITKESLPPLANPYFAPVQTTPQVVGPLPSLQQKIQIKGKPLSTYIKKYFGKKPSDSHQKENRQSSGEMSRRSRYREEDKEIECVITDDSFLLDSYDNKGKFSKLGK